MTSDTPAHALTLPDGRTLSYGTYGVPLSETPHPPLIYSHGYPSSQIEARLLHAPALRLSLHIISLDRPGMGHSTFQPSRTLLSYPSDILSLTDHLQIPSFTLLGASGGAPFVLACLHSLPPSRLLRASVVSGMWPADLARSDDNMLLRGRLLLGLFRYVAPYAPSLVGWLLDWDMGWAARDAEDPEKLARQLEKGLMGGDRPEVDRRAFRKALDDKEEREVLVESLRGSLRESARGAALEGGLYGMEWGFGLEGLDASRLAVWHGAEDVNVPVGMADRAVEIMGPGVVYRRLEGEAHFSTPYNHMEEILKEVVDAVANSQPSQVTEGAVS